MAAHGICFEFYYRSMPSQTGQIGSAAAANACLADCGICFFLIEQTWNETIRIYP